MWRWILSLFRPKPEPPDSGFPDFDFTDPIPLDISCPETQPTDWGQP